ncbi:hypothetical protein EVAR_83913_1 [Eumeta japonica]|uniref:Uncharacterized protein n=1 Tax=Eumeta variegata TaxID=151549 RepID=A0A4C1URC5_EUMVA|nr:hypothetical protein EVAR_83913_1 [Eumeta japonica]
MLFLEERVPTAIPDRRTVLPQRSVCVEYELQRKFTATTMRPITVTKQRFVCSKAVIAPGAYRKAIVGDLRT